MSFGLVSVGETLLALGASRAVPFDLLARTTSTQCYTDEVRSRVEAAIQREYMGLAQGTLEDRYGWLTPVPTRATASSATRKVRREPVGDMSASAV